MTSNFPYYGKFASLKFSSLLLVTHDVFEVRKTLLFCVCKPSSRPTVLNLYPLILYAEYLFAIGIGPLARYFNSSRITSVLFGFVTYIRNHISHKTKS